MYKIGDTVVYGTHGVCTIIALEDRSIDRKVTQYFVLEPSHQPEARYYVPTQNEAAVSKLRKLLTIEELNGMLRSEAVRKDAWITDESKRKQYYREVIGSGDRAAILSMVNALHIHKRQQAQAGRKFHLSDENFLRDAEKLLSEEFSVVLGIPADRVAGYVIEAMSE